MKYFIIQGNQFDSAQVVGSDAFWEAGKVIQLLYLDGAENYEDWKDGDIKAVLTPTATPTIFKADWYGKWKADFPTWQERRAYIHELFSPTFAYKSLMFNKYIILPFY